MLIKDCRLADKGNKRFDVRISGERVSAIAERIISEHSEQVIQANGALLTSSLTEPHAHLDKAFLAERILNPAGDLMGAIRAMDSSRELITVADTIERAERAVRLMVRHGVTAIRTHVDVKVENGMDSIEALLEVRARTSDIVEIQICAMLDWPLSGDTGKQHLELGRNAIRLGADLIGGCPHLDENTVAANIALIELAGELGCGLDLHTDEHTDATRVSLEDLAQRIIATGFE
ncbi:MAG: hydrolase, partial [Acidimicrobiaceae bacterium]|nr:hydrolase [Acidimicrobiaceae bacterium]